jgi:deoxyadenosine/deoxycytidine kinase
MYISLIGPFGIGKTTIARYMADSFPNKFSAVFEDLTKNAFIKDVWELNAPTVFEMQVNFFTDICDDLTTIEVMQIESPNFVLYDRSLLEAAVIYPKFQNAKGLITKKQEMVLSNLYTAIKPSFPTPDLVLYCKADPHTIYDRIRTRNRPHEAGVTLEDVIKLHEAYEEVIDHESGDVFCFDLDTEQTLDEIRNDIESILYKVY